MIRPEHLQLSQARTARDHVIFGMNLEPEPRRRRGDGLVKMLWLEA
jgi:hypothetical protein